MVDKDVRLFQPTDVITLARDGNEKQRAWLKVFTLQPRGTAAWLRVVGILCEDGRWATSS